MRCHWLILSLLIIGVGAAGATAEVIALRLVDSVGDFTTDTVADPDVQTFGDPTHNNPPPGTNDNLWGFAADSSNTQSQVGNANDETTNLFNYVWVSRADLGEDTPQLTTTISGLSESTPYNIYLYQVTHDSLAWSSQTALSGMPLTAYGLGDGVELESTPTINLERILLGQVSGLTSVDVITDDAASGRSFIKGFGVEVVPEPASLILFLSALVALLASARRRVHK